LWVSFAEYRLFHRALLQKRPIILMSLLIVANSYSGGETQRWKRERKEKFITKEYRRFHRALVQKRAIISMGKKKRE